MSHQLRTYRVWVEFQVPKNETDDEISRAIRTVFYRHAQFNMRRVTVEERDKNSPAVVRTWARIDAPASIAPADIRPALIELYRSVPYHVFTASIVVHERPDDIDTIIDAYQFRRGADEEGAEPGVNEPARHSLTFWWCSTPADGQERVSVPRGGTFLAEFHSRGPMAVPAVGDTVSLFATRVNVIGRNFSYEYSDAYVGGSDGALSTETRIDIYVELPLTQPFTAGR